MRLVIIGLSITSSWGNGHATTYRGLVRELARLGHDVLFLERDAPWYTGNRDLPEPPWRRTVLYSGLEELDRRWRGEIADADAVIVGSYVHEGAKTGEFVQETARGVRAFYDIDTPVTLAKLARGEHEYLRPELIPGYDLYLSFTGGPILERLEKEFGSPMARPLYCSVDPEIYFPERRTSRWSLGYLGTYSDDRQPGLERLLLEPSRQFPENRFVVAGPQYPPFIEWPANVDRIEHLPPSRRRDFYNSQRFTLNITRQDMIQAGWSPSVRLFEAAACATPIVSDWWEGLDELFEPGKEIVVANSIWDVLDCLENLTEAESRHMGRAAREKILAGHTSACRARQLEEYIREAAGWRNGGRLKTAV